MKNCLIVFIVTLRILLAGFLFIAAALSIFLSVLFPVLMAFRTSFGLNALFLLPITLMMGGILFYICGQTAKILLDLKEKKK